VRFLAASLTFRLRQTKRFDQQRRRCRPAVGWTGALLTTSPAYGGRRNCIRKLMPVKQPKAIGHPEVTTGVTARN